MKKIMGVFTLLFALFFPCLSVSADEISIVTTIFSEYDWVQEIVGDNPGNINLTLLSESGVDLHSYQPTAEDILTISGCDLFIYVGGESDEWAEDILDMTSDDLETINLLNSISDLLLEEEAVEGMESEEEEEGVMDEHVWLSLKNAEVLVNVITEKITELDPDNADYYMNNAEAYINSLEDLDEAYQMAVENASGDTLLFADRFPFRYLASDYGLTYYAAFSGCSAETEASFETIVFLAEKVDELGLNYVLTVDGADGKIAETVISSTDTQDQEILTMNSMQSINTSDIEDGATYLLIMQENLAILTQALE